MDDGSYKAFAAYATEMERQRHVNKAMLEAIKQMIDALNGTYIDDRQRAKEALERAIKLAEGK